MADRTVLVRLQANISDFRSQMQQAERSVKGVGDQSDKTSKQATTSLGRMAQSARDNQQAWNTAGTSMAAFGAATVVALGATVKAAIDWESAWAGVTKTVSGTPKQLADIEQGLRGLARTMPATHGEIAAVAEAAGQLGVQTDSIVGFTKTMVDLGETTNLSADEAATSLAQLMNVMQTAPDDVGRLGASLVALGNAGASTEADIVNMASYLTGSAKLIGASESDVLALANAMTSMGINAERGGGVMTRTMQDIYAAVQSGGTELENFAKVAGMSSAEFARAFEADPVRAIDSFIQGLNTVEQSGGNVIATLADLGIKGTQDTAVLLQMKGAGDLLTESLDLGSKAWAENTALVEEAAKRYDTTAAKLEIARNNITEAAIEVGEVFLPMLADFASGVADLAAWFADLPDPIQEVIGGLGAVAGVAALAGGAFLLVFPRVIETYKAFQTLQTTMPGVASGMGKLGKAAGIAAGMYLLGSAVSALDAALRPTPATMEEMTDALLDMEGSIGSLDERARSLGQNTVTQIDGFADAIKRVTDPSNMDRLNDFGGALFNVVTLGSSDTGQGAASRRSTLEFLGGLDQSLALLVQNGNADMAAEKFGIMADEAEANGVSVNELKELLPEYEGALQGVANEQKIAAESAKGVAGAVADIAPSVESIFGSLAGYAAHLGLDEDATEELIKKTEELGSTLAGFVDPLGVYTGMLDEKAAAEEAAARATADATEDTTDSWEDYANSVSVSIGEYMARLEEQLAAQENWKANMLRLAGRVSQGTIDELAAMGAEGADLVAKLVNASDEELDRFDDITAARSKEATDAWGAQLTMATPVLAEIARKAGKGAADGAAAELAAGTKTIAQIAADYGVAIAGGVNPILASLGKPQILQARRQLGGQSGYADGAVVDYYANGGVRENHVAQIASAGDWRVWAEPETGGEAYIPLSPAKRDRSVDIWRETGRRLGVQEFASGGFHTDSDVPKPYSTSPFGPPLSTAAAAAMEKEYDTATAWLRDNAGTLGTGNLGAGVAGMFAAVKRQFPEARLNSGFRPGDPGYHGLGRAIDLGQVGRAGGNGHPYLAAMNRWLHDTFGANLKELIYDGAGDDRPDLKNGRPLTYNAATRAGHRNHVHVAMEKGGILNPHVRDAGGPLLPGYTFNGTGAAETVIPSRVTDPSVRSTGPTFDYDRLAAAIARNARSLTVNTSHDPQAVVRAIRAEEQQQAALASVW